MKLINDNLKIIEKYKPNKNSEDYIVESLDDSEDKYILGLLDSNMNLMLIKDYINYYKIYKNLSHKYILKTIDFKRVKSINLKPVYGNLYYILTEYTELKSLNEIKKDYRITDIVTVFIELFTIIDFLHFNEFSYDYLTPDNIFISDDYSIKLSSIGKIIKYSYEKDKHLNNYKYIAPELFKSHNKTNFQRDYYSLGILLEEFLLPSLNENHADYKVYVNKMIDSLKSKNIEFKQNKLRIYAKALIAMFKIDYVIDYKQERQKLYFDNNPIGIDSYINETLEIDKLMKKGISKIKGIIISGDPGTGKTKVLKELCYRMELEDCNLYRIDIDKNDITKMDGLKRFVVQLIEVLEIEYNFLNGTDIIQVSIDNAKIQYELKNLDDKYALLNKIAEGFISISRIKPTYISVGHLSVDDLEIFNDIDFLISRIKIHNVLFLFTIDYKMLKSEELEIILNNWIDNGIFVEYKLKNLDEKGTIRLVESIVGTSTFPKEFSKLLFRESQGNPKYLNILLKHFLYLNEIFINCDGEWQIRTKDYDEIYFPQNFRETIRTSFNSLSKQELRVLEIISCFEYLAAENIVSEIMNIEKRNFINLIDGLVDKKILYKSYTEKDVKLLFAEGELKRHIYNRICDKEKIEYHSILSDIFLEKRSKCEIIDFNCLVKQLNGAGKLGVLFDIIEDRIYNEKIKNSESAIALLELLFSKLDNKKHKKRLEVLEQLIQSYISIGNYSELEPYIDKLENISKELDLNQIVIKSKLYRLETYVRSNDLNASRQLSLKIRKISEVKRNPQFLIEYIRIEALLMQALGKNSETISLLNRAIELSDKNKYLNSLGDLYNLLGIAYHFEGDHIKSLDNYEKAIEGFKYSSRPYDVVKPLSNIGSIYNEVFSLPIKALDYFKQSYNIAEENNLLNGQSIFINNIGEAYFNMSDFENSEIYFKKSIQLSKQNKDKTMEYLATINLGFTYISRERLRDAVHILHNLRQMNKYNPIVDAEINMKYTNFLGLFYTAFGDLIMGKKFSQLSADKSKDVSLIEYMKASSRTFFIDSKIKMDIDYMDLEDLIMRFRDKGNILDRAYFILNVSFLSLRLNQKDVFIYLMEEFNSINNLNVEEVYKDDIYILNSLYKNNKELLIKSLNLLKRKDTKLALSKIMYFSELGKIFYEMELNDLAIKSLLSSLDLFYKTINNLGIRGYEEKLEHYYTIDSVKALLSEVFQNGLGIDVKIDFEDLQKNYYDLRFYLDMLTKDDILRIYKSSDELNIYKDLTTLTMNFCFDYGSNINQLLEFISFHTLAEHVTLKVFNYPDIGETTEYSYSQNKEEAEINSIDLEGIRKGEHILINRTCKDIYISDYDDYIPEELVAFMGVPIFESGKGDFTDEKRRNQNKRGAYASILISTTSGINLFNNEALEFVVGISKLIHLNLENEKLFRQSNYDKLTGVLTRSAIEKKLEELTKEHIEISRNFAVMMLDIDKFKFVNDTYGHQMGDRVLNHIGDILKNDVRATDYVGRYGGEEFLLILENINNTEILRVANKILSTIENYKEFGIKEKVTASIGISKFPEHTIYKDELIYKSDQALYYSKEVLGRNQVSLWDDKMHDIENLKSYVHSIAFGGFANNINNIISLVDLSLMNRQLYSIKDKIFSFLGMIIDGSEAETASLLLIEDKKIYKQYTRKNGMNSWVKDIGIDNEMLIRATKSKESFTTIKWHSSNSLDMGIEKFNIKSLLLSPILVNGILKGVLYLEVLLKNKEFTSENIGFVETLSGVFSCNLK
ncbi:MAG: diguanylate cyclase [Gudongella sp.]|nr:diguanylate cyclase [Gudongella sp.]